MLILENRKVTTYFQKETIICIFTKLSWKAMLAIGESLAMGKQNIYQRIPAFLISTFRSTQPMRSPVLLYGDIESQTCLLQSSLCNLGQIAYLLKIKSKMAAVYINPVT